MEVWKGRVYLFFAFTLAGTSVIAARFVTGKLGSFTISATSLFFALLFLLPFYGQKAVAALRMFSVRDYLYVAAQAVFGIFLFRMFLLFGLRLTSSAEAGILTGAIPAITAILAAVFLHEPVNGKKICGILSTVCGILFVQGLLTSGSMFSMGHVWGNLLVLCAAASESLFNIISRLFAMLAESVSMHKVQPNIQTTIVAATAFLLCTAAAIFERPLSPLLLLGISEWLALIWYGVFVTAIAFIFWYAGIKRCDAFTAASFSGMMPFTSILLSVIILKENMVWYQWVGGLCIIAGMLLIGTGDSKTNKVFLKQ